MSQWTAAFEVRHAVSGNPLPDVKVYPTEIKAIDALPTDINGYVGFGMAESQSFVKFAFELAGYVTQYAVVSDETYFANSRYGIYLSPAFQVGGPYGDSSKAWAKIGAFFTGLFNDEDDDDARIWAADSEKIRAASNSDILKRIDSLIDGPTGDDDELALIRIFSALDCSRNQEIVSAAGLDRILDNVDGEEWDQIMVLFANCGIVSFSSMDDDASRLFVNRLDCNALSLLSVSAIAQLIRNMFAGSCGDDDEDAILKLLRCLSGDTIRLLVREPGLSLEKFDYNFDGDQWDSLEVLFHQHGLELDT
jgi:hypothetical protein